MPSIELLKAIAVTAELCGRTFSEAAAAVFVQDLAPYPEAAVMKALVRCRKEVRGALTLSDVISRIDDGRPGVEEAWAMLPYSEATTAVWTDEMREAFGSAMSLIDAGAMVEARMVFKESYIRLIQSARDDGREVSWSVTMGHDVRGRESVLRDAVAKGRLALSQAQQFIPQLQAPDEFVRLLGGATLQAVA